MRFLFALIMGLLLALSSGRASADPGDHDPFSVAPDRVVADASTRSISITVVAADDVAAMRRPRASLIVYRPDGTMVQLRRKSLRAARTTFRLSMSHLRQPKTHLREPGTYLVFAVVEAETQAFGMPTSFEVPTD